MRLFVFDLMIAILVIVLRCGFARSTLPVCRKMFGCPAFGAKYIAPCRNGGFLLSVAAVVLRFGVFDILYHVFYLHSYVRVSRHIVYLIAQTFAF